MARRPPGVTLPRPPPLDGAFQAGGEGPGPKWLRQEIICAQLENPDLVLFVPLGSQNDNRHGGGGRARADLVEDAVSVHPRQIKVQQDRFGRGEYTLDITEVIKKVVFDNYSVRAKAGPGKPGNSVGLFNKSFNRFAVAPEFDHLVKGAKLAPLPYPQLAAHAKLATAEEQLNRAIALGGSHRDEARRLLDRISRVGQR